VIRAHVWLVTDPNLDEVPPNGPLAVQQASHTEILQQQGADAWTDNEWPCNLIRTASACDDADVVMTLWTWHEDSHAMHFENAHHHPTMTS
jgi:hypothetical protein